MSEMGPGVLSGVAETLLIPLYYRAVESKRPDAMIRDENAVALVSQMGADFDRIKQIPVFGMMQTMRIIFTREFDRYAREFQSKYPDAVVVHTGCGLDSRFKRVDNGRVEWYDLDLPEVIVLRRGLLGENNKRYHLLGCSMFEDAWMHTVKIHSRRPFLFLAEKVLVYFTEEQIKRLVFKLRENFPGAALVFDGWRPFETWLANLQLSRSQFTGQMRWSFWNGREIEGWGDGIRLLDEWGFFDQPEPRMNFYCWTSPLFHLFKPIRLFHFQLGKAGEKYTKEWEERYEY